ncbi:hypothetical protein [Geopseudomonas aromaticivorans]
MKHLIPSPIQIGFACVAPLGWAAFQGNPISAAPIAAALSILMLVTFVVMRLMAAIPALARFQGAVPFASAVTAFLIAMGAMMMMSSAQAAQEAPAQLPQTQAAQALLTAIAGEMDQRKMVDPAVRGMWLNALQNCLQEHESNSANGVVGPSEIPALAACADKQIAK